MSSTLLTPFRLALHEADGSRVAWVMPPEGMAVFSLRIDKARRRWVWARFFRDDSEPPEGLVDFLHDHAEELDAQGFNVRRFWHLWRCWDCGALPLNLCRSHATGKPMSGCHKGRKPRGERP